MITLVSYQTQLRLKSNIVRIQKYKTDIKVQYPAKFNFFEGSSFIRGFSVNRSFCEICQNYRIVLEQKLQRKSYLEQGLNPQP